MTGPDEEQNHGLIQPRVPTSGDAGRIPEWISSERGWFALIITSTAVILLFSVYCLSHGITIIFMHLFYFPIVLLAYRYRYRGFLAAILLSLTYVGLVYFFDSAQPDVLTGAWYRFLVFVGIAAVVAYLSEQLMTGRKALEESERKLKLHADFTSDWEFWIDTETKFIYITPSCTAITGYTPDEFYTDPGTMIRIIHPDDRAAFTRHLETYLFQSVPSSLEFRIIRKDGQTRWIEHVCQAMHDPQGNLIGRRGSNRDITERIGFEVKLRIQNQIFETIAEGINLVRTSDGVIVYTNSKFDRMFGYEKGELVGKPVLVLNAPDEEISPVETAREIMRVLHDRGEWRGELKNIRKDGSTFWCLAVISTFEHPEFGNVWISAHTDITARKQAEEAVKSGVKLNSLVDLMSVSECMVYTLDEAERLTSSRIGFFHFVNEGEKTIQLVAWSTETKKHCVIPSEPARQYPVEKAGVWVDCIRERKAVIHNDYASLPHKKGLPEGHVPVSRELVVPVFDADQIVAIIGVGNKAADYDNRDIDILTLLAKNAWTLIQRKRAEEALKESEERLRTMIEQSPLSIQVLSPDGRTMQVNHAFEELWGVALADLKDYNMLRDDQLTRFGIMPYIRKGFSGEAVTFPPVQYDTQKTLGSGEKRWVQGRIYPVRDTAGNIRNIILVHEDITERRQAEEVIRKSGQEWQTTFNAITDAVFLLDDKGRIIRHNRAFETYTGKPADMIDGSSCFEVMHGTAYPLEGCPFEKAKKSRQRESLELKIGNRWFVATVDPVFSENGEISGGVHLLIDITERKKAEDELRQSEERFRTLSETSLTGIYIFLDGVIRYANPTFAKMYGYTPEEMIGMDPMTLVHPDDRALVSGQMQGRLDHVEEISVYECRMVTRDRRTLHVSIMGALIPFQGRPAISGNLLDITEQKRAEEALRESGEKIRLLLDSAAEAVYGLDKEGNCTFCNNACLRILGYRSEDELLGKNMHWMIHARYADGSHYPLEKCRIYQAFQKGEGTHVEDEVLWRSDGASFPAEYWSYPQWYNGEVIGAVVTFFDITERKVAEVALRESEERYRLLFDESPISLWEEDFSDIGFWFGTKKEEGVTDFRTYFESHPEDVVSCVLMVNVTRINRASMALFGAHSLQEFSEGLSSVFTPESYDSFREELIAISMGRTWFECEVPLQTVSGERKIALLKMIVVPGFEQTLKKVVISLLDITERKKMEDALRQANKKITMLSSITRHDIKNQLLSLRGFLGLSQMKERDPELLEFMKKEERAAEAISSQIEFTKFYEDIGVNAPEWQDIFQIIQAARSQLPLPDTVEFAADLPPVKVFADGLIEKVFYNLMENTLRHGEQVSRIRFSFCETASGAEIVYEDNGVGISLSDKQHLFQKGFGKNTGLGLFLSQEILAITGLTIQETGEPGKGVRFVIAVPKDGYRFSGKE